MNPKITFVIVTYNRLEKLKKCLSCISGMAEKPFEVIVVNNASTDGTQGFLFLDWQKSPDSFKKEIIDLDENYGGSAGFHFGVQLALKGSADWIYVSDDDAYPDKDLLKNFYEDLKEKFVNDQCGAIVSVVRDPNGISIQHRRRLSRTFFSLREIPCSTSDYFSSYFSLDLFSFVGAFLQKKAVLDIGLPKKDYFIWYDDTDFSIRMRRKHEVYCFTNLSVFHDSLPDGNHLSWKNYYGFRNRLLTIRNNFPYRYFLKAKIGTNLAIIKCNFLGKKDLAKILKSALRDAKMNKAGKNPKYLPGIPLV